MSDSKSNRKPGAGLPRAAHPRPTPCHPDLVSSAGVHMPAYYRDQLNAFLDRDVDTICGRLIQGASDAGFATHVHDQTDAWTKQIELLHPIVSELLRDRPDAARWSILLEFPIPRRSKRIDAVILADDLVLVIEFKIGKTSLTEADRRQAEDYALDLRDFHKASAGRIVVPLLAATGSAPPERQLADIDDVVKPVIDTNGTRLITDLLSAYDRWHDSLRDRIRADAWDNSPYEPTPTILEAAQVLYAGQSVREISRSHAGADNLNRTTQAVLNAIREAQREQRKIICFLTGVPGAGKTLAGLNIVHDPALQNDNGGLGVFLSGNGPLVTVLSEALARDHKRRTGAKIDDARRHVSTFVQNVHAFVREYVDDQPDLAPPDKVVLFDEAQRAWNSAREKRKFGRDESEPSMMLRVMDRHADWAVIVALIGGGQEIHDGEAGLPEWGRTIAERYPHWRVHISSELARGRFDQSAQPLFEKTPADLDIVEDPDLHLAVALRSFRADQVAAWVDAVLSDRPADARQLMSQLHAFPIRMTRDLSRAKRWLRTQTRGHRRCGLVASSGGRRLRADGLDVKAELNVANWFLDPPPDVRSSYYLELPATEFAVQGLELDWVGVCWGGDLRRHRDAWTFNQFRGSKWQSVADDMKQRYLLNKYRVLMTRAREGFVIYIPTGDPADHTRPASHYQSTATYLQSCGVVSID